jgi:4-hydroxybenzoate decarboxylase subunit C
MKFLRSTRDFVQKLQLENELQVIDEEVDVIEEIAEIQRRIVALKGPALLFTNVKGFRFPVATNLYGSAKRIELAFGTKPKELVQKIAKTVETLMPPSLGKLWAARELAFVALKVGTRKVGKAPVLENSLNDVMDLPAIKSWPDDGGRFVTLPLVYTESPVNHKGNLGMYRIQFHDAKTVGMHIQIHRGGGFHYFEAESKSQSLPAHIYVGGPPAMTLAAIAPLPEELSELVIASLALGDKLNLYRNPEISPLPVVADSDFLILGDIPPFERRPEGPFGDHYGYYALQHDYPVLRVKKIYHRKDAIWPATVVGRPPQEDHYLAEYVQELLSPMFPLVMPKVVNVWAYEESGVHTLTGAVVKERYHKEAFTAALRILGEGHLSLTKCLMVTNERINLKNFKLMLQTIVERMNPATDLHIFANISQDTLDYTGPQVNKGSKMIILGVGDKKREFPKSFEHQFRSSVFSNPKVFVPGVLVLQGSSYKRDDGIPEMLVKEPAIEKFGFVFLVDNSQETVQNEHNFLWTIFTRFEPAGDIYGVTKIVRNHIAFEGPIVFDCRLKDWYPKVLVPDEAIEKKVEQKFGKLFSEIQKRQ